MESKKHFIYNTSQHIQDNTPKGIKIMLPLLATWITLTITALIPLPSYLLVGITFVLTIIIYKFISYIIEKEETIIKEHKRILNDFHDVFVNLSEENKKLNGELEAEFKDFDKYVISSKTDLFGRITYASTALCKISGYSQKEMLGKSHNILRHPDMPKSVFKDMWNTIEDDRVWAGEVKNLKKNGLGKENGCYWVNAIISPIYDYEGNKIGYNSIRQNITNKKILQGCKCNEGNNDK